MIFQNSQRSHGGVSIIVARETGVNYPMEKFGTADRLYLLLDKNGKPIVGQQQ
ncbi:MAG: DUF6440 family protein [Flavonifractor plautii]|uniref:DUF6440 family protein n=1 Tax=Flavonifractor plautii TaxID=292800 RepID=UPI00195D6915|nr:DUF6440 family protein [Flavonifractor plautii]MBM6789150.1 hypothetical protein [Flavonifractor plautii]MDU3011933.1 DUF6440 family protein [Flavonifractor plautii]MDU6200670.1 DUF6440 family protein [Flavonifractor plautii]MDU6290079.1 DUF6440 family protein [Flavonifractor plautii]MDU6342908.1 DUF6440 family protein [Flavonifractor plautii]